MNSSPVDTNETIEDLDDITTKNEFSSDDSSSVTTEDTLVQKLLEEIQFLKIELSIWKNLKTLTYNKLSLNL